MDELKLCLRNPVVRSAMIWRVIAVVKIPRLNLEESGMNDFQKYESFSLSMTVVRNSPIAFKNNVYFIQASVIKQVFASVFVAKLC